MPSEKILQSKKELVEQLVNKCKNAVAGVLVDYKGIDVAKDTALRKELREANVEYFVVKNTMLRLHSRKLDLTLWTSSSTEQQLLPLAMKTQFLRLKSLQSMLI